MAGLSVLLETQEHQQSEKSPKILSKATMMKAPSPSHLLSSSLPPPPPPPPNTATFLDACFLCRRRLDLEKDIYMYRGDRAFCSVECRCRHMFIDEESVKREYCSFVASSSSHSPHRKGSKTPPAAATTDGVAY